MIAHWIAGALLRGQDHLRLNKKELVDWQLQGCRVSNGSPHNLWGQYARMHVGKQNPFQAGKMADLQWYCRRWRPVLRPMALG